MSVRSYLDGALFVEHRDGPAPTILAMHGWGRTRADMLGLIDGRAALVPDLPGFGSSPAPPEAWGTPAYAAQIADMLVADGRAPYVVVGHSFGGRVAAVLAAEHRELVAGVVFLGVPLLHLATPKPPAFAYRAARWACAHHLLRESSMEKLRQRYGSADYKAAHGVMRAVLVRVVAEDYTDYLTRITVPVAFCWGANDSAVPVAVAQRAATVVANVVAFDVVDTASHDVMLQAPERARAALDAVIDAAANP